MDEMLAQHHVVGWAFDFFHFFHHYLSQYLSYLERYIRHFLLLNFSLSNVVILNYF